MIIRMACAYGGVVWRFEGLKNGRDIPNGVRYDLNRNTLSISSDLDRDRDRDRDSTFPQIPLSLFFAQGAFSTTCHFSLLKPSKQT